MAFLKLCLPVLLFVGLIKADVYCEFEKARSGVLDCSPLSLQFSALFNKDALGEVASWNEVHTIRMRNSNVAFLDSVVLSNAKPIQHFDISMNIFRDLPNNTFKHLTNLRSLNVSANSISILEPDAFKGLVELRDLDISKNLLSIDEIFAFAIDNTKKLRILDVSGNQEMTLSALNIRPNLKTLIASGIPLVIFDDQSLTKTTQLSSLDLSKCNIKALPSKLISQCPLLTSVDFSSNINIPEIPAQFFARNVNLKQIDLHHNSITSLNNAALFSMNKNLRLLDLSENSISIIHAQLFVENKNLVVLKLSSNKMERLPPKIFDTLVKVILIDLSNNRLLTLPNGMFAKNILLDTITLSGNLFKSISTNTFQKNVNLKVLNLSNNNLGSFSIQIISDLKELVLLDLDRNYLSTIPEDLFYPDKLLHLYISCNNLTQLPLRFFDVQSNYAKKVYLRGNPWKCACLNTMLEAAEANEVNYESVLFLDGRSITCIVGSSISICNESPLNKQDYLNWQTRFKQYPEICDYYST